MTQNINSRPKKQQHSTVGFDAHLQAAVQAALKNNIKAEVNEAAMIVAQETKKALSSFKMRLDALENLLLAQTPVTLESLKQALWEIQETLFELKVHDGTAGAGNGIRLRVKEEVVGQETDAPPSTESYAVLGEKSFPPEIEAALLGCKAGEVKVVEIEDAKAEVKEGEAKPRYKITIAIDRVYEPKSNVKDEIQ